MTPDLVQEIRERVKPALQRLLQVAEERNLTGLAWEDAGLSLRVRREPSAAAPLPVEAPPVTEELREARLLPVLSTRVGVFRGGPVPGGRPPARVGEPVREGQVLAHVESMRLMNEITAPRSGRLAEILVEEGHAVEYGQPLLVLETSPEGLTMRSSADSRTEGRGA